MSEAKNNRYILSSQELWFKYIATVLKNACLDYKIKDRERPYSLVKFASFFDKSVKMLPFWDYSYTLDNNRSKDILGIQYKSGPDAIISMAESLIDLGLVEEKRKRIV